jgi:anti-sigma factor RsiW
MPLFVGDDLRPGLAAAVRSHIDACPGCREEFEGFRAAMAGIKATAKAEGVGGWTDGEWDALMARVAREGKSGSGAAAPGRGGRVFQPSWAAASVLGAFLGLVVLGILFRGPSSRLQTMRAGGEKTVAAGDGGQDRLTMTLVSPESGLQVVWIFDKNFDWKGDQE